MAIPCVYRLFKNEMSYIGSTIDLDTRKRLHINNCYNPKSREYRYKVYENIRNNGGFDDFQFEILEYYNESISKKELRQEEQKYMDMFEPSLNGCNAYGHKISKKDYMKKWNAENKEYLNKWSNEKIQCECGNIIKKNNKSKHKKSKKHLLQMKLKNDC